MGKKYKTYHWGNYENSITNFFRNHIINNINYHRSNTRALLQTTQWLLCCSRTTVRMQLQSILTRLSWQMHELLALCTARPATTTPDAAQ